MPRNFRKAFKILLALGLFFPEVGRAREFVLAPLPTNPASTTGDASSVQTALDGAADGDVITLLPGTYLVNLYFPRKLITLRGDPGAGQGDVILDGSGCVKGSSRCSVVTFQWENSGGEQLNGDTAALVNVTVTGGTGSDYHTPTGTLTSGGGGVWISGANPTLSQITVSNNVAKGGSGAGGGIHLRYGDPTLSQVALGGNTALYGGGIYMYDTTSTVTQATLSGNEAIYGGAAFLDGCSPTLHNSIVAFNVAGLGSNFYSKGASPLFDHTLLYLPDGTAGLYNLATPGDNILEDPLFYDDTMDGSPYDDDLHLREGSPARDAGDFTRWDSRTQAFVSYTDPDGTAPDLGALGGLNTPATDVDNDGAPDDWEVGLGLDTSVDADADGDGLTDGEEFNLGTDPISVDSDGDGYPDGQEVSAASDPDNGADPGPDPAAPGVVKVPEHYPTITQAIDSVADGATIQVAPGTYPGNLEIWWRSVILEGREGAELTTLDARGEGSAVTLVGTQPAFDLRGFTLTGGTSSWGGGLYMVGARGSLEQLNLEGNEAGSGGGMYLTASSPVLSQVTLSNNSAADYGGGIYMVNSAPTFHQVTVAGNWAEYGGGGMYLHYSIPTSDGVTLHHNLTDRDGAGIYFSYSPPTLSHITLSENVAGYFGGGMYLYDSNPTLSDLLLSDNHAYDGGGMYLTKSSPTLSRATLVDNKADGAYGSGGGVNMGESSPLFSQVSLLRNSATASGGGMMV